ncbi:Uncharacterized conserved protein YlxW, UPF0749 family [Modestobacter sp. DSM 44400]|nr:Uncharacterized conserved protein YlxW, UPF0749 family [Modestobacter sp. DSM 44400]
MSRLLTGALTLVLGFAATVQIRETRDPEGLTGATQEDLVEILDSQKSEEDSLRQQIAEAQQAVDTLGRSGADTGRALTEVQQQAAAIALLNGTAPASGPGVRVAIADPQGTVPPSMLLSAIEELRGAGAEAIQVNGVRVVASSYVIGSPGDVEVDGNMLSTPYELLAIGPTEDLMAALTASGSLVSDVARSGGSAQVDGLERVEVSAVVGG